MPFSFRNRFLTFYNFKLYNLASQRHFLDFKKQPFNYLEKSLLKQYQEMPILVNMDFWPEKSNIPNQEGYDLVELASKNLKKGKKSLLIEYKKKVFLFINVRNMKNFIKNPNNFAELKLPIKFLEQKDENKRKALIKDSSSSYLENNLANIVMRVLATLGLFF